MDVGKLRLEMRVSGFSSGLDWMRAQPSRKGLYPRTYYRTPPSHRQQQTEEVFEEQEGMEGVDGVADGEYGGDLAGGIDSSSDTSQDGARSLEIAALGAAHVLTGERCTATATAAAVLIAVLIAAAATVAM